MHSCQRLVLLIFIVCAALCVRCPVNAYISGAPPESCDTMRAVHSDSTSFSDCAVPSLCPAITIDGVDVVNNMFQYNCSQNYTFTMSGHSSSLRGFMVEFRTSSNSTTFNGSLSHVGEFAIASGHVDTTRLECGGHAVTQTKINTDGYASFVWTSPGRGQQGRAQMWYTQITSSRADFLPREGVLGVPSDESCNCPADTYLVVLQTTPTYHSECVQCPENSTSERGISQICQCLKGLFRIDVSNSSEPCSVCTLGQDDCVRGTFNATTCSCDCPMFYDGTLCDKCALTQDDCIRGTFNPTTCSCDCPMYYDGTLCDMCTLQGANCTNGGTLNSAACECDCPMYRSGVFCETCTLQQDDCVHGSVISSSCSCDCPIRYDGILCDQALPCMGQLYEKVKGTCRAGFHLNPLSCLCEKAEKIVVGTDVPANTLAGIIVGSVTGTIILTVAVECQLDSGSMWSRTEFK